MDPIEASATCPSNPQQITAQHPKTGKIYLNTPKNSLQITSRSPSSNVQYPIANNVSPGTFVMIVYIIYPPGRGPSAPWMPRFQVTRCGTLLFWAVVNVERADSSAVLWLLGPGMGVGEGVPGSLVELVRWIRLGVEKRDRKGGREGGRGRGKMEGGVTGL